MLLIKSFSYKQLNKLFNNMRSYTLENNLGLARSTARILDGKALASQLNSELTLEIKKWILNGNKVPKLSCILVGDDPASQTYVRNKANNAKEVGVEAEIIKFGKDITETDLIEKIKALNKNTAVDGILVQLPLPSWINERNVCNAVDPTKDVDGFHVTNVGKFCLDMPSLLPATPLGVLQILKRYKIETFGRNVVVIGRSKNVSMPIAMLLHTDSRHESGLGMDATVTICHRYTPKEELKFYCRHADIIITATGLPKLVKADMVKPGATIIDIGITRIQDENGKNKLVGDVDYEEVSKIAGAITPVPGGVGPMTVAMLMQNTFQAARERAQQLIKDNNNV